MLYNLSDLLYSLIDRRGMIMRLTIMLSIVCLCVADVGWAAPKPQKTVTGNIYYLRADGTAANKAAATSGASASTAMSIATHNSETFEAGDHIRLCDTGGTYKTSIVAPSSGKDGQPIVYEAAPGHHPVIDLSMDVGADGWKFLGEGVYQKKGYGRVLWEDGVPLHPASNTSCTDGNWFYQIGSGILQYKPTSGAPADHNIQTMWFGGNAGWGYGIDIRNRSNIEISGLTFNRCGIGTGVNSSNPVPLINNVSIHDNTINNAMWAIFGNLISNSIMQDVDIYNNQITYCNSGISIWTNSDKTVGHTQHPLRVKVHKNMINNLYSIDSTHDWSYALLKSYYYTDHEGISFQDPMNCIVADNTITCTTTYHDFSSDEYWSRAIYFFITTNGYSKTSGNQVLRNKIYGAYLPSIYISGIPDQTYGGIENNIFALNVIQSTITSKCGTGFQVNMYSTGVNTAQNVNYWVNNIINLPTQVNYVGISMSGKSGYWTFRNNIITSRILVKVGTFTGTPFVFDHNNYHSNDDTWGFQVGNHALTFTQWKSNYSFDTTASAMQDPRLNRSNSGITILSPSQCKTGGTPIEGVTVMSGVGQFGIDGRAFDPKHPSMGAYAQPVNYDKLNQ